SIQTLDLSNNRLTGDLPDCWCNFKALMFMDLSNNRLTRKLLDCWWNLEALIFMDLSNNSFSSKIPAAVASHNCYLRSLYLAGNGFIGAFPPVLEGCNLLDTLDMGNNKFFGVVPPWIGTHIPLLRILSLKSNNFTGVIPMELSRLSELQLLDISNNSLTGSIPLAFGSLTSMKHPQNLSTTELSNEWKYYDRIDIIWKGHEQKFGKAIQLSTGIDLSGNLLSRCIPEELANLQGIQFLNLSRNHLSCSIPENISSLTFLESLDLSSNGLTGAIPSSISSVPWLTMLNVSNNLLSGKIPAGNQLRTLTDPSVYSNNSGLCGFPLNISCTNTSLAPDERNGEEEDHWMYYCVIVGIVSGLWLWFGMLFTVKSWRCGFLSFVDGMQCKIMKKL
ncbi:receptor-like protein EIX2, partial [Triticum dicoccoides]|uniref:receptor-like protein EIX2 n=1 Tax=Triticum dicoccoides TaxID=85692 RepID=UPI00188F4394